MIGKFPIVLFDTSAHNRLAEGGPVSEALLAGIKSGMHFRFAGLSVDEMVACDDLAKKTEMFRFCDLAVRDKHSGERYKAGHNDLLMSVYLPYCDKFVTAEKNREQEKCLREVAAVAELETEILSYDDFCDSFLVKI